MPLPFRLAAFYCAHFVHGGLFMAYFPLYLAWRGFGALEIAWVVALPGLIRMFAPAGWGWLADRTGALRALVMLSCASAAAGFAALLWVDTFVGVVLVVAAASLFAAGGLPLVEVITLNALSPGRYGPVRLWGSVGFIAAVLAGGAWLDLQPVRFLPWPLAAFALVALAVAASLPAGGAHRHAAPVPWRLTRPMIALLGAGFFMSAAHGTLYTFFSLHLENAGYRGVMIGALWSLGVLAEILVFLFLPQLFRRFSLSSILIASFVCATIRFLALGWLAQALWIVVLMQLLHAATFGAFHAAAVAAVHRTLPAGAHARGQSLFSSVTYGAGAAAGALAAGSLWELGGPTLAFSVSALAGLVGLHLAHVLKRCGL